VTRHFAMPPSPQAIENGGCEIAAHAEPSGAAAMTTFGDLTILGVLGRYLTAWRWRRAQARQRRRWRIGEQRRAATPPISDTPEADTSEAGR
jgi:hypothetical protein